MLGEALKETETFKESNFPKMMKIEFEADDKKQKEKEEKLEDYNNEDPTQYILLYGPNLPW